MRTFLLVLIVIVVIVIDIIPLIKKKQRKEAVVLLMLGAITLAYGYYYNTHSHTASLVDLVFNIFNTR